MFGATAVRRKREKERRERAARNSANTIYPFIKPFGKKFFLQGVTILMIELSQLISQPFYIQSAWDFNLMTSYHSQISGENFIIVLKLEDIIKRSPCICYHSIKQLIVVCSECWENWIKIQLINSDWYRINCCKLLVEYKWIQD